MRIWRWKRTEPLPSSGVDWVVRYRSRRLGRGELHALREWLAASRDHARDLLRAEAIWRMSGALGQDLGIQEQLARSARRQASAAAVNGRPLRVIGIAAAAAASLAAIGAFLWYAYFGTRDWYETAPGQQRMVMLPEGSSIAINTDTRLAVDFSDEQRLIVLKRGEALFEVTPDWARPFVVRAANGYVRAVGTRFNVLVEDRAVTVAVLDGRVEVATGGSGDKPAKLLDAGQSAAYERNGRLVEAGPERASRERIAAWREGKLSFDAWSLERAIHEHNRYAVKPLRLRGADLGHLEISGVFRIGDTKALVYALGRLMDIQVIDEGDVLVITASAAKPAATGAEDGILPAPAVSAEQPTPH